MYFLLSNRATESNFVSNRAFNYLVTCKTEGTVQHFTRVDTNFSKTWTLKKIFFFFLPNQGNYLVQFARWIQSLHIFLSAVLFFFFLLIFCRHHSVLIHFIDELAPPYTSTCQTFTCAHTIHILYCGVIGYTIVQYAHFLSASFFPFSELFFSVPTYIAFKCVVQCMLTLDFIYSLSCHSRCLLRHDMCVKYPIVLLD